VTRRPTHGVSWSLLVVLVVALATGAAASILVGAPTAPPPAQGSVSLVYLPQWVITAVSLGFVALIVGSLVLWKISSGPSSLLTRQAVTILVVVLLGIVFVFAMRAFGSGNGGFLVGPGGSTSGTGPGTTTNITNVTGSANGSGHITFLPGLPGWVPMVLLVAIVLIVAIVAVPQTRRYLIERHERMVARRGYDAATALRMRSVLGQASTDLELGGDAREVILALYAAMLRELQPMADDLGPSTPEEIRSAHLVRLGVQPEAARTLTRLFEEARYSTHPMGPTERTRAQEAVRSTIDDLARRTFAE